MEPPPSKLKRAYEKKSARVKWADDSSPQPKPHVTFSDSVEIVNTEDICADEGESAQNKGVVCVNFGMIKEKYTYIKDFLCRLPPGAEGVQVFRGAMEEEEEEEEEGGGGGGGGDGEAESVAIALVPADEVASRQMQCPAGCVWLRATVCAPGSGVLEERFHLGGVEIAVTGKVMGSGRGTPSLRDDVHCVGFNYSLKTDYDEDDD